MIKSHLKIIKGVVHCVRAAGYICTQKASRWLHFENHAGIYLFLKSKAECLKCMHS